jgi:hypothetical protein
VRVEEYSRQEGIELMWVDDFDVIGVIDGYRVQAVWVAMWIWVGVLGCGDACWYCVNSE